jgi:hypothetical protein
MLLERCGGTFWSGQKFGALWVMADDSPVSEIVFENIEIRDPTFSGIMLKSETHNKPAHPMNITFENVTVGNPGTSGILITDAMGTAAFKNTKLVNAGPRPVVRNQRTIGDTRTGVIQLNIDEFSSGFGAVE